MSAKYELPRSITQRNGTVLNHNWHHIKGLSVSWETQKEWARRKKAGIRKIQVLSRNLRGKLDLRGKPYTPGEWIFCSISHDELLKEILESNTKNLD